MPRTIESIVECHRTARERIEQGRPVWDRKIPVREIIGRDQDNSSEEHAAAVAQEVAALIRSRVPAAWFDVTKNDYDMTLDDIVESLESLSPTSYAGDPTYTVLEDLNNLLDGLYDWADYKRIWLGK